LLHWHGGDERSQQREHDPGADQPPPNPAHLPSLYVWATIGAFKASITANRVRLLCSLCESAPAPDARRFVVRDGNSP